MSDLKQHAQCNCVTNTVFLIACFLNALRANKNLPEVFTEPLFQICNGAPCWDCLDLAGEIKMRYTT